MGWVRYSLFRWKSGFEPQVERQIELARSGNGWILRNRGVPGRAAVESSTNLRDWEAMGEMDTELSITPAAGSPRFYRLRME